MCPSSLMQQYRIAMFSVYRFKETRFSRFGVVGRIWQKSRRLRHKCLLLPIIDLNKHPASRPRILKETERFRLIIPRRP